MKIGIATDHNGVNEKKELIIYLKEMGYEVIDYSPDNNPVDDYPDFASRVSIGMQKREIDLGILMCGTGIGMSIVANKYKGIICGKVSTVEEAHLTREHNHANIVALSYKAPIEDLKAMIKEFLNTTPSEEERHVRRVKKIMEIEE